MKAARIRFFIPSKHTPEQIRTWVELVAAEMANRKKAVTGRTRNACRGCPLNSAPLHARPEHHPLARMMEQRRGPN